MNGKSFLTAVLTLLATLGSPGTSARAQGTAFTYQGRLSHQGAPVSGAYDLTFAVFMDSTGVTQAGVTVTNAAVAVTNGLFTTTIDFGKNIFIGYPLWLQIGAETNGGGGVFTLLSPLQAVTSAPYAIDSLNAGTAQYAYGAGSATYAASAGSAGTSSNLVGTLPISQVTGTLPQAQLPGSVVTNNAAGLTLSGSFSGDGSSLSNVPVALGSPVTLNNAATNPVAVLNYNTATNPVPVYDVDNPARHAVTYTTEVSFGTSSSSTVDSTYVVPAGERLVIECVSGYLYGDISTNAFAALIQGKGNGVIGYFGFNYVNTGAAFPMIPSTSVKIYVDAGSGNLTIGVYRNGTVGTVYAYVTFSGYLISVNPP